MSIGGRWRRRCEAVIDLRVVNAHEPPPEWCPLPCEPSGNPGELEEP